MVPAAVLGWLMAAVMVGRPATWSLVIVGLALVVAACAWRRPALALAAVLMALLAASVSWQVTGVASSSVSALAAQHRTVTIEAHVRRDVRSFERHGQSSAVVPVTVRRVEYRGTETRVRVRAVAFVRGTDPDPTALTVGRRFVARAELMPSDTSDQVAELRISRWAMVGEDPWWWAASERVREGVRRAVSGWSGPAAALVPALVVGDESAIDERTRDDFDRSGLTHLLAVSGTNLTIVIAAVMLVVGFGGGRRFLLPVAVVTIVTFVLVARPEPSVLRAAVMGLLAATALGLGRPGGVRALAWAVLALLVVDPWLARAAGFVLSVSATAGIIVLAPPLAGRFGRWLPRWLALALAVPLAAHVACLPALVAVTGEASVVAVFANVLAGPAVAPATVAGLLGGVLDLLWPAGARLAGSVAVFSANVIVEVAARAASADGAAVRWSWPWWTVIALVPLIVAGCWVAASRPVAVIGVTVGLAVVVVRPPTPGWPPADVVMVACDVGQGDASVVPLGPREALVIDVGQEPAPIDRCLRRLGVTRIRLLVFSHGDADHVGGWQGAVRGREVEAVMVGPSGGSELDLAPVQARAGDRFTVGEVSGEVLWPDRSTRSTSDRGVPAEARNDASLVVRITVRGVRILFTGDLGAEAERRLVRSAPDLSADVLKMPHHGSADLAEELLDAVVPRVVTISAGADNDFGHPAPSALTELRDRGIAWWRTDLSGDLAVVRRSGGLAVVAR